MLKLTLPWLSLPLLISPSLQLEQPNCLSLNQSTFCRGAFRNYSLSDDAWIYGKRFANIDGFDYIANTYFGSYADRWNINKKFDCGDNPGWSGDFEPPYRASYECMTLLDKYPSMSCNIDRPVPRLCRSACLAYTDGWAMVIRNQTECSITLDKMAQIIDGMKAECEAYPFNGQEGDCITGMEDQPNTCGYILPEQKYSMCAYCKMYNTTCCQSPATLSCYENPVRRSHHISTAALVCSIVFGCLGGISLVALGFFLYRRRKPSEQPVEDPTPSKEISIPELQDSTAHLNDTRPSVCEYVCEYPYNPALPDELALQVGDVLAIMWMFNDGWAVGKNLTRGGEGAFPMACVTTLQVENLDNSNVSTISNRIPRRISSKRSSNRSL